MKTVCGVLRFFGARRIISRFVDELEELGSVVVGGKGISDLLAILGLADHLLLADLSVRNVDVRPSLQIVKLHKSLLGVRLTAANLNEPEISTTTGSMEATTSYNFVTV